MNILLIFLLAQTPAIPMKNVSCKMENHIYSEIIKKGDKFVLEDRDDWHVRCKITIRDKVKFDQELPLARPTEFPDAVAAIDKFRKENK